ncbi:MAG: O-methyltransferase [Vicinamibacterales bacterium]
MTEREYIETLVPERVPELRAMEAQAETEGFPIIGPACGHLCYQVARTIGARRVFELGSGFGYSTAFFARAVVENGGGVVHHTVWDQALSDRARTHLDALGDGGVVTYHVAEAVETLRRTPGPFDLVFNDIDKEAYPGSLAPIEDKLRPGGVLLVDNMLWGGRAYDSGDHSPATEGVRELTRRLVASPRWITSLVPLRDGLVVATWLG